MKIKSIKIIIGVTIFFLISSIANSQSFLTGAIKGKIIDKATKQSIPGANVIINGTQRVLQRIRQEFSY